MPILLMGLGAVLFFAGAIWLGLVDEHIINKPSGQSLPPPTLFSLFMSDLQPSKGMIWKAFSDFDVGVGDKTEKVRIFYNIYDDFIAHSKYMAFYVPAIFIQGTSPSSQTFDIVRYLASGYPELLRDIQDNHWAEMKNLGDVSEESTKSVPFSGRIFFYCADNLSIEQLAELRALYQGHRVDAQFRGMDYALAVWDSIQLGRAKAPLQYELQNGVPHLKNKSLNIYSFPPHRPHCCQKERCGDVPRFNFAVIDASVFSSPMLFEQRRQFRIAHFGPFQLCLNKSMPTATSSKYFVISPSSRMPPRSVHPSERRTRCGFPRGSRRGVSRA
jgi:hypothetical protein